jgi:hypothetical protein
MGGGGALIAPGGATVDVVVVLSEDCANALKLAVVNARARMSPDFM